jgi:hypothetical protein
MCYMFRPDDFIIRLINLCKLRFFLYFVKSYDELVGSKHVAFKKKIYSFFLIIECS